MLPVPGDLVGGKYRIVRLIGEGGMGVVYEARHEHLGSQVALKFLLPDLAQRPALVARFLQEARVSASIKSPHVTHVVDVDQTKDGEAYLVMELLEGESLETRIGRGMPLPLEEAVDIGLQILSALEAAHARGVVHRDLKPDNVWLSASTTGDFAQVKLLDFGIAKLKISSEFQQVNTRPGSMMGTPAYMAPEQAISADQVDHRADLYSFGVILYEMLSGARPVDADDPNEILEKLVRGEIHPLASRNKNVPPGLAALVDKLVAPNPDERPSSATTVRRDLARYARNSVREHEVEERGSTVPRTLPPDDRSAPPFVTAAQAVARVRTDSMPRVPEFASAPTALATAPPVKPPRRSHKGAVFAGLFLLAAAGGAGVWAYLNPSVFDDSALPPMPAASPNGMMGTRAADAGLKAPAPAHVAPLAPFPVEATAPVIAPAPRAVAGPISNPETRSPSNPENPTPTAFPRFTLPPIPSTFAIPSSLIPPGLIPSVLPPFFQQIPGFGAPPAPQARPSEAPPAASAP